MTKSGLVFGLMVALSAVMFQPALSSFKILPFQHTSYVHAQEEPYYIGNRKCRLCHFEYFKEWEKDPHANAFTRLGRMQNNPYCLKCHTTGFRGPQGFVSEKITPQLRGVQCEACHGPGSKHKDNPHDKGALPIGRKIDYQRVCINCHDRNWTPEFDYEKYRKRIEHRISLTPEEETSLR
ncbi:MAG: cytochrome c family protein [Deltaproteobacteria bacterium]|nr:cytochrome c family protein [Deltaproteobacteria bacterium]